MIDPDNRYEQLITKLREHQYRMTPQRMALIRLIATSAGHPNAAALFEQVRSQYPTMSRATVYKTLELLKELGEVLEIDLRAESHYDGNKPYPHPHLMCTQCGCILDGVLHAAVQDMVKDIEQQMDFQVTHHQLNFYGLCNECREKVKL